MLYTTYAQLSNATNSHLVLKIVHDPFMAIMWRERCSVKREYRAIS